jgi:hypothetical protein
MTKKELIYSVFEKLKITTDDDNISEEFVSSLIDGKRAMLLKQQFEQKSWNISIESKQELCIDLELVDSVDGMSCFGKILKSKSIIPQQIKSRGKEGPISIRTLKRSALALNVVPIERLPMVGYNTFINQMIYCSIDYDGYLYLVSNQKNHVFMKSVKVSSVFAEPDSAFLYECDSTGDVWDADYPLERVMADTLIDLVVKDLSRTFNIPEDNTNDATDDRSKKS